VSYINVVSKEQALDFIEHDQTHNASWGFYRQGM
jgi:structural maintenance of chromosome 3 (chondroitin sulfate proteoglycan 6)